MVEVLAQPPANDGDVAYTFHSWELLGLWAWLPAFLAVAAAAKGEAWAAAQGWAPPRGLATSRAWRGA
jgi:hypothetical protein